MASNAVIGQCRQKKSYVVSGVHEARARDAPVLGPLLSYERSPHGPLAADADPGQQTQDGELPHVDDEGAQQGEYGIPQDGQHQGANPAELVSDRPPEKCQAPAHQKQREQQPAIVANVSLGRGNPGARQQFAQGRHQHQRIDKGIHAVERPSSPRRPETAQLIACQGRGSSFRDGLHWAGLHYECLVPLCGWRVVLICGWQYNSGEVASLSIFVSQLSGKPGINNRYREIVKMDSVASGQRRMACHHNARDHSVT